MATNIGKKIEDYASKNLQALKQEEAKTGKKFTKYDIALFMLSKGELNKSDFASWMNTSEGFASQTLSKQQSQALKQGNVWSFAGYGSGEESYLDSLTPFSQKSDIEKINLLYSPNHGLGIQSTGNERENRVKEINEDLADSRKVNVKKDLQENKIKSHWESLPEVTASYTELMNSIKFKEMSKEEQVEFLLKTAGEKFNEAREKGDKSAMKEYLMQGIGLAFQKLDNETGITKFKDWAKERSGLNTLVEYIDEKVDNNSADLSVAERIWENIKGIGDFADSLAGTQGVAMIGAFMILGEAVAVSATSTLSQAAAAKVLTGFQALLTSYFGIEGGKLVYDGVVENLNASSKEDVRAAGQKLGSGAFMLYGAGKGAKQFYQNVKTMYQASQVQAANQQALADARKTLGLDENVELTEATLKAAKKAMALKAHPDKGGSVEAMQQVNAAYDLLKASLSSSVNSSSSASASSTVGNSQNVTSNTPVRYTQAQQVNATKTTYQLINNGNVLMTYNNSAGVPVQVLDVPQGTLVSTPSGYKVVEEGQCAVKVGNAIDVINYPLMDAEYFEGVRAKFSNEVSNIVSNNYVNAPIMSNLSTIERKAIKLCALKGDNETLNLLLYDGKPAGFFGLHGEDSEILMGYMKNLQGDKFDVITRKVYFREDYSVDQAFVLNKDMVKNIIKENKDLFKERLGLKKGSSVDNIYENLISENGEFIKNGGVSNGNLNDIAGLVLGYPKFNSMIFELESRIPNFNVQLRYHQDLTAYKQELLKVLNSPDSPYKNMSDEFKAQLTEKINNIKEIKGSHKINGSGLGEGYQFMYFTEEPLEIERIKMNIEQSLHKIEEQNAGNMDNNPV